MRSKISFKLIFAVGCVIMLTIGIFSYAVISAQQEELIAQVELSTHQLSETIKSSMKHDMMVKDRERVHQTIDTIGSQSGIEKVRIINKEGEIIFSSDKSVMNTLVDMNAEACYACHVADQPLVRLSIPERTRIFVTPDKDRKMGMINPIYNEPGCWQADCHAHAEAQKVLGILDITMSLTEVDAQIRASQIKTLIFGSGTIAIVSLLLFFFVQRLVGTPVTRLVRAINEVAAGDLNHKIEIDSHDELGNLAKSFNDMTEKLSDAQRQLYQSDKLASIGRLAAGVAHELNNPLTGVLTYSSYLLKRIDKDEDKADLEVIVRETKRCRQIVKELLDFARPVPSEKKQVPINEVLQKTIDIISNQLKSNVVIVKHLSQDLPLVWADENQLFQVFINLFVNAADALGEAGGEITVTTSSGRSKDQDFVAVRVTDSGCGISPEGMTKIFEPFYTTKGQRGTGLGLAMVWGIVEKHKGHIDVESTVGEGTTFTLHFPLSKQTNSLIKEGNVT
ncbi:ATP-binding protein [Deltaproteobacteria bacterium TL4]